MGWCDFACPVQPFLALGPGVANHVAHVPLRWKDSKATLRLFQLGVHWAALEGETDWVEETGPRGRSCSNVRSLPEQGWQDLL